MELPLSDRADVAAELLASLDEQTEADQQAVNDAWAREIEHRARRLLAGETTGEAWEQVQAHLTERLTQRWSIEFCRSAQHMTPHAQ